MDQLEHAESPVSGARDGNHVVMVPERRGVEPFNLESRLPRHDDSHDELLVVDHDWLAKQKAESALRQSQEELRSLSVQLLSVQEQERQRIAADLHDGLGQSLSLINLSLEQVAQSILDGDDKVAVEILTRTVHKVKDAMAELRRTTSDLRPPMLDDLGIVPTMTWFVREFESACRKTRVEKDMDISENDVPARLKATIFRILQEAMNNIIKHADADAVRVSLKRTGGLLQFLVEDNGRGFDPAVQFEHRSKERRSEERGTEDRRIGLLTMKERARSSNGMFEIRSACGKGTRIQITWRLDGGAVSQTDAAMT